MNILFLCSYTNRNNTIFNYLVNNGNAVNLFFKKNLKNIINQKKYNFIISYGYRYKISKKIIDKFHKSVINLHISYLPYNRGADPNIWSFLENTPKGVTIHLVDEYIDKGDIIFQKKIKFNNNETLKSTYNILCNEIEKLFIEKWTILKSKQFKTIKQKKVGTFHYKKDLAKYLCYFNEGFDTEIIKVVGLAND